MTFREDNIIGIIGGMGPLSGHILLERIMHHTNAQTDQEHPSVVLMSFPRHLADRTAFLEGRTDVNPADTIVAILKMLEIAGASIAGIPCNTSHAPPIFDKILEGLARSNSRLRLVNMPEETCRSIRVRHPQVSRVGIMATNGTYKSRLYSTLLGAMGYQEIVPEMAFQDRVIHQMIYHPQFGIKASPKKTTPEVLWLLDKALAYFRGKGAEAVVLGCTEFSTIASHALDGGTLVIDSTDILAQCLVSQVT